MKGGGNGKGMQQEPMSRGQRVLAWIVGVMGVLIVVGFAIVLVEIGRRMFTPKSGLPEPASTTPGPALRPFGQVDVRIPEGAKVESLTAMGDRLIAHVRTRDGASVGLIIDAASGAVLGTVRFTDAK